MIRAAIGAAGGTVCALLALTSLSFAEGPALPCGNGAVHGAGYILPVADIPCTVDPSPFGLNISAFGQAGDGGELGGLSGEALLQTGLINLQVDGIAARDSGDWLGQVSGHAFLSGGELDMLGLYASWAGVGDADLTRLGAEAAVGFGDFSLEAVGGWQSEGKHNVFFDSRLNYQVTDGFSVYAGGGYDSGYTAKAGFEAELAGDSGIGLFSEAALAEGGDVTARVGVSVELSGLARNSEACVQQPKRYATHWWLPSAKTIAIASTPAAAPSQSCAALPAAEIQALGDARGICPGDLCTYFLSGTYTGSNYATCIATVHTVSYW
jgi:hypothetical protein